MWCSVTSVKTSKKICWRKKNLVSSFIPLHYNLAVHSTMTSVCVNSCLLSCFPFCLLCSGVRYHSLLHSPNVSQVSLCSSILVNLFDIMLEAVTSTLLPALPAISIVPAIFTSCSIKHTDPSTYMYPIQPRNAPGALSHLWYLLLWLFIYWCDMACAYKVLSSTGML